MTKIKGALTRKWGPLPAWAWFAIVGGIYYFYRKYSATASGTGTGSVAPAAATPQAQTVLQPGESVYDPNSGTLTTAPGGGGGGSSGTTGDTSGSTAADLAGAMNALAGAIASGMPPEQVQVTIPGPTTPGTSGTRVPLPKKPPKKRKSETKTVTERPVKTKKPKTRGRSKATVNPGGKRRTVTGQHRTTTPPRGNNGGRGRGRATGGAAPSPSRARQRPRTPAVTYVPTQRRQGGQQPGRRPAPTVNHRPSAPPPRTVRSPAKRGHR